MELNFTRCHTYDKIYVLPKHIEREITRRKDQEFLNIVIKLSKKYGESFLNNFFHNNLLLAPKYQRDEYEDLARIVRDKYLEIIKNNAIFSYSK